MVVWTAWAWGARSEEIGTVGILKFGQELLYDAISLSVCSLPQNVMGEDQTMGDAAILAISIPNDSTTLMTHANFARLIIPRTRVHFHRPDSCTPSGR